MKIETEEWRERERGGREGERETILFFRISPRYRQLHAYTAGTTLNHGAARLPELNLIAAAPRTVVLITAGVAGVKMGARLTVPNTRDTQRRWIKRGVGRGERGETGTETKRRRERGDGSGRRED